MDDRSSDYTDMAVKLGAILVIFYMIYLGAIYRQQSYMPKSVLNRYIYLKRP